MFTDASGIIQDYFNDAEWHNLTILWHDGVLYEYLFNTSISEDIYLATKSIDAMAYWDELNIPVVFGEYTLTNLDLLWSADGTSWVVIETIPTNLVGMYQFSNLIMSGYYALSESGDEYTSISFTIDQLTAVYTDDIYIVPDKTIIDIDYLNTVFGADYPVDLTDITYGLYVWSSETWVILPEVYRLAIIVDEVSGIITIYEFTNGFVYSVYIGNAWNDYYTLNVDGLTNVDLVAKSLEATCIWSSNSTPVIDTLMSLYWFDGTSYVFVADYLSDFEGKIYITELLPIGAYKLGITEFTIIADDVVKTVTTTVESLFWRKEPHLNSIRDVEFRYFFFFVNISI